MDWAGSAPDMGTIVASTLEIVLLVVIGTGLLQNALYVAQLALALQELATQRPEKRASLLWRRYADISPPISLLVPAFNEQLSIVDSLRSMLALNYPSFEVIAVNDGSKDETLQAMIDGFGLKPILRHYAEVVPHEPIRGLYGSPQHPRLLVIDKGNGGKSDALNAGINLSRFPIFCAVDADSILESDALLRAVQPFIDDPVRTVAVGGTIRIANGCRIERGRMLAFGLPRNLLALFQTIEYLRAFLMARLAWSRLRTLTIISGAFGLFKRQTAIEVGGYSHGTVGEDMELVVKLHRHLRDRRQDYQIVFVPEPVCWTEAPESWRVLGRQRSRWQRGALETFFRHRDMLFRPRYGRIGLLGFGHVLVVDVLGPPIEVLGYVLVPMLWMLDLLSMDYLLAFLALTFVFGIFVSVASLILEEIELQRVPRVMDLLLLTGIAVLENFGYRQISNLWRLRGMWQFLRGAQGWGVMSRVGFRST
jgi:cellulose synthase/poly-beta-1,6-N-acetylglucosamine synthase-like glycosyltransferase